MLWCMYRVVSPIHARRNELEHHRCQQQHDESPGHDHEHVAPRQQRRIFGSPDCGVTYQFHRGGSGRVVSGQRQNHEALRHVSAREPRHLTAGSGCTFSLRNVSDNVNVTVGLLRRGTIG